PVGDAQGEEVTDGGDHHERREETQDKIVPHGMPPPRRDIPVQSGTAPVKVPLNFRAADLHPNVLARIAANGCKASFTIPRSNSVVSRRGWCNDRERAQVFTFYLDGWHDAAFDGAAPGRTLDHCRGRSRPDRVGGGNAVGGGGRQSDV